MKKLFILAALLLFCVSIEAQVFVTPTRLLFEGNKTRTNELTLVNNSNEKATFRISFYHTEMLEDGNIVEQEIEKKSAPWSDRLIRFSPRQTTLEAHGTQIIRTQLRLPENLPSGEYRSNLKIIRIPTEQVIEKSEIAPTGIEMRITIIPAVAIPVIVRVGNLSSTETLGCVLAESKKVLECRINREGTSSIYVNVIAKYIPLSGKGSVVGVINGLAVYVGLDHRDISLPIILPPGVILSTGKLEIVFSDNPSNKVLASTNVSIP